MNEIQRYLAEEHVEDFNDGLITGASSSAEMKTYAGVDHAFHNDTGSRYHAERSREAWVDTVEWFRKHLV